MLNDEPLAAFQAALLELLDLKLPAVEVKARLLEHEAAQPYRDYVEGMEPRCIEIGQLLVEKWGLRKVKYYPPEG